MTTYERVPMKMSARPLIEAVVAYVVFCLLSIGSRYLPPLFLLVVVGGIALPLLWARLTHDWAAIGFTRRNLGPALLWGVAIGALGAASIFLGARLNPFPEAPLPGLQLAIGIPIWLLFLSPFQELFFRGWLQPRFDDAAGRWGGLIVTTVCFVVWHFISPFQGTPGALLDIASISSILTMVGMGLAFGYSFQRTGNIVAPWLAHAMMGVALVSVGGMTFIQYT
jgi:membrane protease YdiL (CAAX protease family)